MLGRVLQVELEGTGREFKGKENKIARKQNGAFGNHCLTLVAISWEDPLATG